jgi:hypothetical protein
MQMRLVIYTCITGKFDVLKDPEAVSSNTDYIVFTEHPERIESSIWKPIQIEIDDENPRRTARKYKILAHRYLKNYDMSLWMDGCYRIVKDPKPFIVGCLKKHDFVLRHHPWRTPRCVYSEALGCLRAQKGDPYEVLDQIERYRQEGYPLRHGLAATGLIMRRHTERVNAFCEAWWEELKISSDRDQLSLPFTAWKEKFDFGLLPPPNKTNDHRPWFIWNDHGTHK